MENKIRHLEMIMEIIERMERNSFSLKSWAMTLTVAVCALSANDSEKKFILIALIPILIFWLLDSFYLQTERKYRVLYRTVSEKRDEQIDFNLDLCNAVFTKDDKSKTGYIKCMFSFSENLFYFSLILAMVLIIILLKVF